MKLWLLWPNAGQQKRGRPWADNYDMYHGFVIAAETEAEARARAQETGADECFNRRESRAKIPAWTDPELSSCIELKAETYGATAIVISDFHAG